MNSTPPISSMKRLNTSVIGKAMIFCTDPVAARQLLSSPDYLANRIAVSLSKPELAGAPGLQTVSGFYQNWLMYQDGEHHSINRSKLMRVLATRVFPSSSVTAAFDALIQSDVICASDVHRAVLQGHAALFELRQEDTLIILAELDNILSPIHHVIDRSIVERAAESITRIRNHVVGMDCNFLTDLRREGLDDDLFINLVIDSVEPLVGVATVLIRKWATGRQCDASFVPEGGWLSDVLKENPPFRYISRVSVTDTNERHVVNIAACNAQVTQRAALSFGHGAHYCAGAKIAMDALTCLTRVLATTGARRSIKEARGEILKDGGLTTVKDLLIRAEDTR